MSARTLHLSRDVAWPLRSDFKTSLLGWGGFIVLLSCYCMVYQVIVDDVPADRASTISITEVFKNWGVWLLTTPSIFAALRKYSSKWHDRAVEFVALVAIVVFISTAVPVAIDLLTNARDAATSLMIFLPRYVAVVGIVYLVWHVFLRERRVTTETVDVAPSPAVEIVPEPPATLLVSKGADQCLIQIGRIESVSAAGNYVEIVERGQRYLMRATLKQIEDLPMSKKHKQALQRYRPAE